MQFLTELARLLGRKQQRGVPAQRSAFPPTYSPDEAAAPQQSATRPTRRIEDHHLLKLHKVIDQSG